MQRNQLSLLISVAVVRHVSSSSAKAYYDKLPDSSRRDMDFNQVKLLHLDMLCMNISNSKQTAHCSL